MYYLVRRVMSPAAAVSSSLPIKPNVVTWTDGRAYQYCSPCSPTRSHPFLSPFGSSLRLVTAVSRIPDRTLTATTTPANNVSGARNSSTRSKSSLIPSHHIPPSLSIFSVSCLHSGPQCNPMLRRARVTAKESANYAHVTGLVAIASRECNSRPPLSQRRRRRRRRQERVAKHSSGVLTPAHDMRIGGRAIRSRAGEEGHDN